MQSIPPVLVFCDLDDTLFDVHSFSVDASARRALNRLERQQLPVVLCSSRTRAELELIQQELGINHPFVSESGAAVFLPHGYFAFDRVGTTEVSGYQRVEFGKPYPEVVAVLHRFAERLGVGVVGFSDMSVGDVAIDCNMPLLQARLAKLREYSEMFRVVDSKPGAVLRLFTALRAAGFVCSSRGRYHLLGARHHDLGGHFIRGLYRRAFGHVPTVAFGDHGSAAPLLRHADVPLVLQADDAGEARGLLAKVPAARVIGAKSVGEWAEAILEIANRAQGGVSVCSS